MNEIATPTPRLSGASRYRLTTESRMPMHKTGSALVGSWMVQQRHKAAYHKLQFISLHIMVISDFFKFQNLQFLLFPVYLSVNTIGKLKLRPLDTTEAGGAGTGSARCIIVRAAWSIAASPELLATVALTT